MLLIEKHFEPLGVQNLCIKSFANAFVDIALTFLFSSFNLFLFNFGSLSSFAC